MNGEDVKKEGEVQAKTERIPTQEELKRMRKQAAFEMAEYKRRLKESVELKRLQVDEIELNIRYYHARQEHKRIQKAIEEEEARELAEEQKLKEEQEKKDNQKIIKLKLKNDK